jgi:hypothetical protein
MVQSVVRGFSSGVVPSGALGAISGACVLLDDATVQGILTS